MLIYMMTCIMNILFCAPHFGMVPQTLPLQLTQPRHPYGTQELLLSAATFLSWHGSQIPVAWDPNVNATYKGQLHKRQTSDWHHPCCSGLQVQGTAISPAAWKLYDKFMLIQYTCGACFCQVIHLVIHIFLCYNKLQSLFQTFKFT